MRTQLLGRYFTATPSPTAPEDGAANELTINQDQALRVTVTSGTISPATTVALSDDMANPTVALEGSFLMGYDGATWDRLRSFGAASATLALGGGSLGVVSAAFYFDSQAATFRRVRCDNNGQQIVTNGKPPVSTQDQLTRTYSPNVTGANHKSTQAQVFSVVGSNGTATGAFLCLVNKASAALAGDAVYASKWCPALDSVQLDSSVWGLQGENMSTGLSVAWSTTPEAVTFPASGTGMAIWSHFM